MNNIRNNLFNRGVRVEYEKEDLPQVNHQLHEWLAIVNEKSSNVIISDSAEKINTSGGKSSEKISDGRLSLSDTEQREELARAFEGLSITEEAKASQNAEKKPLTNTKSENVRVSGENEGKSSLVDSDHQYSYNYLLKKQNQSRKFTYKQSKEKRW